MVNLIHHRSERKFDIVGNFIRASLLLGVVLLAGASATQAQVSFGIRIGPPPRPRVVRVMPAKSRPGVRMDRRLLVSGRPPLQVA